MINIFLLLRDQFAIINAAVMLKKRFYSLIHCHFASIASSMKIQFGTVSRERRRIGPQSCHFFSPATKLHSPVNNKLYTMSNMKRHKEEQKQKSKEILRGINAVAYVQHKRSLLLQYDSFFFAIEKQ